MSDIEQLIKWCEQAREILKVTGSKRGAAAQEFQKALDKTAKGIRELTELAGESLSVRILSGDFERIAEDAHGLATARLTSEEKRESAKAITVRLNTLSDNIAKAKPVAEKVHEYQERMKACQKKRNSLAQFPYNDLTDVNNVINEATLGTAALDDPKLVEAALKMLNGFDNAEKLAINKQKEGAKAVEKNLKAQQDCLDRLREVNQVLQEARATGFGVHAEVQALQTAITAADKLVKQGEWKQALDLLNSKKPSPLPNSKDIRETSQRAMSGLPVQAQQAREQLALYRNLVDDQSYADAATSLDKQLHNALYQLGNREQLVDGALQSMKSLVQQAESLRDEAVNLANSIAGRIEEAKPNATQVELQGLRTQLEMLRVDIQQKHLTSVVEHGQRLLDEATKSAQEAAKNRKQWTEVEKPFDSLIEQLTTHSTDPAAPPDAKATAKQVAVSASRIRGGLLGERDWANLLTQYSRLQDAVAAFNKSKQAFEDFALLREEGQRLMSREFESTTQQLEQAESELKKRPGLDVEAVLAPFRERLANAFKAWENRVANATSDDTLDAQGMSDELTQLAEDISATLDPQAIEAAENLQKEALDKATFEKMVGSSLESLFTKLEDVDLQQGSQARVKLDKLRANPNLSWEEKLPGVEEIAAEMQFALKSAREKQAQREQTLLETCRVLTERLNTQKEKLKSTKDKTFLPLFLEIEGQLSDQRALAKTPNVNAADADAVEKELGALEKQIKVIEAMASGGSAFEQVRSELTIMDQALDKATSVLQENVPKTLAKLKKLAAGLHTEVLTMTPDEAINEIKAFRVSVNEARTEARRVDSLRSDFNNLKPIVENKIKLLEKEKTMPPLVKVLQKRLDNVETQAKSPDKLNLSKQQLDQLNRDVEEAFSHPEKGLEMQKKVLEEAERQRRMKVQCESGLANVKKAGVKRAQAAVKKAGGDTALLAELGRMIDDTAEIVKGGDYAEGLRKIALIQRRVEEVISDPYGPGIGSRKELPKDAERFTASAKNLITNLKKLPQMAADGLANLKPPLAMPEPVRAKLIKQIEQLTRRINPVLFDEPARRLSDSQQPVRDRREVREAALQAVRDTRALLNEQPQFAVLWDNPFYVELKANKIEVDQRLLRLEANIRRSVH